MATNNIQNRLITPELEEALKSYPLYSQDGKKKDATCIVLFTLGNIRWYIFNASSEPMTHNLSPTCISIVSTWKNSSPLR